MQVRRIAELAFFDDLCSTTSKGLVGDSCRHEWTKRSEHHYEDSVTKFSRAGLLLSLFLSILHLTFGKGKVTTG